MRWLWALSVWVLAPSVLGMAVMVLTNYRRRRGRLPHVFLMAISYLALVGVAVLASIDPPIVPLRWIWGLLTVALLLGVKGLLLIAAHGAVNHETPMRWWPEREVVRWAVRRISFR